MELWKEVLTAFGGGAALLASLAYLVSKIIDHRLSKASLEYQIKYSSFNEKQADAIATIYALTRKFNSRLKEYLEIPDITSAGTRDERRLEAVTAHREFLDAYEQKQIYLSRKSVSLIGSINSESKEIFNKYLYQVERTQSTPETGKEWLSLIAKVENSLESIFIELENEFRSIVGNKR